MPDNPTTGGPVTRSAEVQKAIDWLKLASHKADRTAANILEAYIAQLEASHPKPRSDEGLRETLVSIVERCQFSKQHGDDIGRQNTISFILRDAQAALSRQAPTSSQLVVDAPKLVEAPVPTSRAVEVAQLVEQFGRAKLGVDGNCGFALLGADIQSGEAEFSEINPEQDDGPRQAAYRALKTLRARLGLPNLSYYLGEGLAI